MDRTVLVMKKRTFVKGRIVPDDEDVVVWKGFVKFVEKDRGGNGVDFIEPHQMEALTGDGIDGAVEIAVDEGLLVGLEGSLAHL